MPWNSNNSDYGKLFNLIVDGGPYGTTQPDPQGKKLAEVDNRGKYWVFPPISNRVNIVRSIRFPVVIQDDQFDEDGNPSDTLEHILIGFAADPTATPINAYPFVEYANPRIADRLGRRLMTLFALKQKYTLAKKDRNTTPVVVDSQAAPVDWEFRGRLLRVELVARIPYVLVEAVGSSTGIPAHVYIGYEGGGAY